MFLHIRVVVLYTWQKIIYRAYWVNFDARLCLHGVRHVVPIFLSLQGRELNKKVGKDTLILFVLDKITEMKNWIDDDICVIMIAIFFSWTILHQ